MDEQTLIQEVEQGSARATFQNTANPLISGEAPFDLGDSFQAIPNAGESFAVGAGASASQAVSAPKVMPFSDEEIVNFTATATLFVGSPVTKVQMQTETDVAKYQMAFKNVFGPIMPTAAMIAPLKLGDALATYGIGKGMGPGFSLEQLPAWVRVTLGGIVLGGSSFMAFMAVKNEQRQEAPVSSVGGNGVGSRSDQQGDSFNTDATQRTPNGYGE